MRLRSVLPTGLAAVLLAGLCVLTPLPAARAETTAAPTEAVGVQALSDRLMIPALFDVLREEGTAYGKTLEEEMFPGGGGPAWEATVLAIYDTAKLQAAFDAALQAELAPHPDAAAEMVAFFASERGQRIVTLEIEARRALLDTAVDEAAQVAADKMTAARDPRMTLIKKFAEAGDLIEMNVAGAMTGNLAFMKGLAAEGSSGAEVPEADMMSDLWGQEDQIRTETSTWLYSYLALAYQPLTDADLEAYIAFSESDAGRRLNAALFTAFDRVFRLVSFDLGRAAGRAMLGRDI